MARKPANIESPEVIRHFRSNLVKFDERAHMALEEAFADVRKVQGWLQRDVHRHWQRQLRRREEMLEKARREYAEATWGKEHMGKASVVDEKKALNKAMRLKEEAELKLRSIRRCNLTLEREVGKRLQPCRSLDSELDTLTPKALARLDQMLDSLDVYFHRAPSGGKK